MDRILIYFQSKETFITDFILNSTYLEEGISRGSLKKDQHGAVGHCRRNERFWMLDALPWFAFSWSRKGSELS